MCFQVEVKHCWFFSQATYLCLQPGRGQPFILATNIDACTTCWPKKLERFPLKKNKKSEVYPATAPLDGSIQEKQRPDKCVFSGAVEPMIAEFFPQNADTKMCLQPGRGRPFILQQHTNTLDVWAMQTEKLVGFLITACEVLP